MQHLVLDLGLDDGGARHARQQQAAQRVAQRVAEAALQRLYRDAGAVRVAALLNANDAGLQEGMY